MAEEQVVESSEVVLPSDDVVEKTPEEVIAGLEVERDQARKDHSELEKLMGRKAQESGDEKKAAELAQVEADKKTAQREYVESVVDDVVTAGMQISDEVKDKLTELGIDDATVKLRAYEYKEKIDSVVGVFGSRDVYDSALAFGAEKGYTQEQLAAHGLKALYAVETKDIESTLPRVMGNSKPVVATRGYSSMSDYSADLRWAGSDPTKLQQVRVKVAQTKDGVFAI